MLWVDEHSIENHSFSVGPSWSAKPYKHSQMILMCVQVSFKCHLGETIILVKHQFRHNCEDICCIKLIIRSVYLFFWVKLGYAQRSLLAVTGGAYLVPGIEPGQLYAKEVPYPMYYLSILKIKQILTKADYSL